MRLRVHPGRLAVVRLGPEEPAPGWARGGPLVSVTRTPSELSVVCPEAAVPDGVARAGGLRALELEGPLDLGLVGVLAPIAAVLAGAGVPLLPLGTYDTDWLLVPDERLPDAVAALRAAGYEVEERE